MDEVLRLIQRVLHEHGRLTPSEIFQLISSSIPTNTAQITSIANVNSILRGKPGFIEHFDGTFSLDSIQTEKQYAMHYHQHHHPSASQRQLHAILQACIQILTLHSGEMSFVQIYDALPNKLQSIITIAELHTLLKLNPRHFSENPNHLFRYTRIPSKLATIPTPSPSPPLQPQSQSPAKENGVKKHPAQESAILEPAALESARFASLDFDDVCQENTESIEEHD